MGGGNPEKITYRPNLLYGWLTTSYLQNTAQRLHRLLLTVDVHTAQDSHKIYFLVRRRFLKLATQFTTWKAMTVIIKLMYPHHTSFFMK